MERKNLLAAASVLLLVVFVVMAMSEDEEMALAMQLSEESAAEQQAAILKPGTHKQFVAIPELARPSTETLAPSHTRSMMFTTKLFKVYQIAVQHPQKSENVSCGPRVIFFAHAIDALHKKNIPIASKTIDAELSPHNTPLYSKKIEECRAQLYSDEFQTFIQQNKLAIAHYYVIDRYVNDDGLYYMTPSIPPVEPSVLADELSILGKDLLENKVKTPVHFFFVDSAKAHWVLVSVIKGPETKPVIYYIDPRNTDLDKYVVAHQFIGYVVDNLGLAPEENV
jgi:hypothetical protein